MKIPESLRSTPCPNISLIITEDVLRLLLCTRHIETFSWMKCRRMILRRYIKANIERITLPLRIFLHKAKELRLCSIHLLQMQKDFFRYSRTQHILPSNLLMCKLMQVCCSAIENENTRVAAINSVSTYFLNYY
jgi:hypothetical protein